MGKVEEMVYFERNLLNPTQNNYHLRMRVAQTTTALMLLSALSLTATIEKASDKEEEEL